MQDERAAAKVADSLSHRESVQAGRLLNHVESRARCAQTISVGGKFDRDERRTQSSDFSERVPSLARIMQIIKGRSARECNLVLSRNGQFWEHESFDHVIREGKFDKTVRYVLNNLGESRLGDALPPLAMELLQKGIVPKILELVESVA